MVFEKTIQSYFEKNYNKVVPLLISLLLLVCSSNLWGTKNGSVEESLVMGNKPYQTLEFPVVLTQFSLFHDRVKPKL